jgi:two-component system nitrate/nitrite response regulator NarL
MTDILLCSKSDTVLKRWSGALVKKNRIFEATTLEAAYRILDKNQIGLTLLHRIMINEEQISSMISIKAGHKVFVFSDRPNNEEGIACLKLGCVGYANSYIAQPRLSFAVQTVLSGLVWTGTSLMQHMIQVSTRQRAAEDGNEAPAPSPVLAQLSKREYQVATLVAEGLNNRQVAEQLDITERTVKAHLSSAYVKTSTKSRLGLARLFSKT